MICILQVQAIATSLVDCWNGSQSTAHLIVCICSFQDCGVVMFAMTPRGRCLTMNIRLTLIGLHGYTLVVIEPVGSHTQKPSKYLVVNMLCWINIALRWPNRILLRLPQPSHCV